MNDEEMREYILKLENENKLLTETNECLQVQSEEYKGLIENKDNEIKELKLKNYELFTQVTTYVAPVNEVKEEKIFSINEITNKLIKGD